MSDLDTLKGRIDRAVQQLADVQTTRRHSNDTLIGLLGDLEAKYSARDEEVRYCAQRIEILETDNRELVHLVEQLVGIMESWAGQGEEDPVFDAAARASNLLEDWQQPPRGEAPPAMSDAVSNNAVSVEAANPVPEVGIESSSEPSPEPLMAFEDVDQRTLAAELAEEIVEPDLPEPLIEAIAEAAGSAVARTETLVVETEGEDEVEDTFLIEDTVTTSTADDPVLEIMVLDEPAKAERSVEQDEELIELEDLLVEDLLVEDGPAAEMGIETEGDQGMSPEDLADMLIHDMTEPVDIEIPDVDGAGDPPVPLPLASTEDPEANIRTMMARLEKAADRAREALEPEEIELLETDLVDETETVGEAVPGDDQSGDDDAVVSATGSS